MASKSKGVTVTMLAQISGHRGSRERWPKPGEQVTLSAAEAERVIRQGLAVKGKVDVETATADVEAETATA